MRRALSAGVSAALAGGALAVVVSAHTTHYESNVNIGGFTSGNVGNYLSGGVTSPNDKCAPDRKVTVFREAGSDDVKFGSDVSEVGTTPGVGDYLVNAPSGDIPSGDYYSRVKKRDLRKGRAHDHICDRAKSSPLDVGP